MYIKQWLKSTHPHKSKTMLCYHFRQSLPACVTYQNKIVTFLRATKHDLARIHPIQLKK